MTAANNNNNDQQGQAPQQPHHTHSSSFQQQAQREGSFIVTASPVVVTGTDYGGNAISVSQPIIVSSSVGIIGNAAAYAEQDNINSGNNNTSSVTNSNTTECREGLIGREVGEKTAAANSTLVTLPAVDNEDNIIAHEHGDISFIQDKAEHHKIVATEVVAHPLQVSTQPEPVQQNAIILFDPRIPDCEEMIESAKRRGLFVTAILPRPEKFVTEGDNKLYYPNEEAVLHVGVHQVYAPPIGQKFDVIECAGHLQTIEIQQNIRFLGVIPFRESAVDYTDTLSALLGINIHNDLGLATARRDKGLMKNAVANAGLRTSKFARLTAANGSDVRPAIEELELEFPVVVKTPRGSSTAGVYICDTIEDATEKSILILKTVGIHDGRKTHYSLLEEFLHGDEFAINVIASPTCPRGMFVTDVWKYAKIHENGTMINTMQGMCDPHSPKYSNLVRYAEGITRAVGIKYGLAHVEVKAIYNEEKKKYMDPVMIEVGARLAGGRKAIMAQASIRDWRPFDAMLDAHCGFPLQVPRTFTPSWHAKHVYIPCNKAGILKSVSGIDFERLQTYHSHVALCEVGKPIEKSTSIMSFPAFVWLCGIREDVERDAILARSEFQVEVYEEAEEKVDHYQ